MWFACIFVHFQHEINLFSRTFIQNSYHSYNTHTHIYKEREREREERERERERGGTEGGGQEEGGNERGKPNRQPDRNRGIKKWRQKTDIL